MIALEKLGLWPGYVTRWLVRKWPGVWRGVPTDTAVVFAAEHF